MERAGAIRKVDVYPLSQRERIQVREKSRISVWFPRCHLSSLEHRRSRIARRGNSAVQRKTRARCLPQRFPCIGNRLTRRSNDFSRNKNLPRREATETTGGIWRPLTVHHEAKTRPTFLRPSGCGVASLPSPLTSRFDAVPPSTLLPHPSRLPLGEVVG